MGGLNHPNQLDSALKELKDIHLPTSEAWWHLPWGMWLLLGLIIIIGIVTILLWPRLSAWHQQRGQKKSTLQAIEYELKSIENDYLNSHDERALLSALSILLRRVCITLFEKEHAEGLLQDAWINFLDSTWQGNQPSISFTSQNIAALLNTGAYRQTLDATMQHDSQALLHLCKQWLDKVVRQHV